MDILFTKLKFRNKNKVLGVSEGTHSRKTGSIILWDDVSAHDQWVHLQYNADNTVSLFFRHSNLCLSVPQSSHERGTRLCQYPFENLRDQKWYLQQFGDYCKLQNVESSLFLAVSQNRSDNGAPFCQWSSTNEDGQFFSMSKECKGYFDRN